MTEITEQPAAPPSLPKENTAAKSRKGRKKVRSAWISFVGRIIAQFVGSAATIGLGVMLLYKYQPGAADAAKLEASAASSAQVVDVRSTLSHGESSIAVLPLTDFSSNPSTTYVAGSMADLLTADLAQVSGVRVVSRTSAAGSARPGASATAIASSLGVRYVLEGSVTQSERRVRITAQLVDASRDELVWARRYERPATNILGVQEEVTADIVREVGALLARGSDVPLRASGTAGTR
jgi:TolB-like protein